MTVAPWPDHLLTIEEEWDELPEDTYRHAELVDGVLVVTPTPAPAEIVSPGSKRTDRIAKVVDYAEAGIPHCWIVDIDEPISLEAFTLVGDWYEKVAEFTAPELAQPADPAPVTIDLAKLAT
jgi:Uma2 family endonuclease